MGTKFPFLEHIIFTRQLFIFDNRRSECGSSLYRFIALLKPFKLFLCCSFIHVLSNFRQVRFPVFPIMCIV